MSRTTIRLIGSRKDENGVRVFDKELARRDAEALKAVHEKQVAQYGAEVVGDFPRILDPDGILNWPVVMCLVAERDGQIVDGCIAESIVEWCHVGCDAEATAAVRRASLGLEKHFAKRGFRIIRSFIPRVVAKLLTKPLNRARFFETSEEFASFICDLRPLREEK